MSELRVTSEGAGVFRVEVRERGSATAHRVTASPEELRRYGGSAEPERLVRIAFEFLLEREPKEAILSSFALSVIERYFPEFPESVRTRLA